MEQATTLISPPKHPHTKFQSLDLQKAFTLGWDERYSLTTREFRVLTFVASRGKRNEPEMAFAWFPKWGQEWWAAMMGMQPTTLRTTLYKLRKKGLLTTLEASARDTRFTNKRGVGIPTWVMEECLQWYSDRQDMVYTVIPDSLGECSTSEHSCSPLEHSCSPLEHRTPHSPTPVRGARAISKEETRERTPRLTSASSPSGFSHSGPSGGPVKYQGDGWDAPKDEHDDFAVPRETRGKPAPYHRPSTRVLDLFHERWLKSRQKRTNLAIDFPVRMIFAKNVNRMLEEHSEADVNAMVDEFFRLVDGGMLVPKSDELWKDFWYNRGKVYRLMRQRTPVLTDAQREARAAEVAEHNRRVKAR